jgi:hypothetical protein
MTGKFVSLGALFLPAAGVVGCFNTAAMQQMQEANQPHSISPSFDLDRNWRIAILHAEGHGSSFDGPEGALYDALAMALGPLIKNGKG